MSGLASYDFTQKEQWRRWKWNRIAERMTHDCKLPCERVATLRNCSAIYLCGPSDHDRAVAIEHGFQNHNLIACDLDKRNAQKVRDAGGLALHCNLIDAVFAKPSNALIDVVDADFCSGFTKASIDLMFSVIFNPLPPRLVSINMLRGRDAHSNPYREVFEYFKVPSLFGQSLKHRGAQWLHSVCAYWAGSQQKNPMDRTEHFNLYEWCSRETSPAMASYRSGNQLFDSLVMAWPFNGLVGGTVNDIMDMYKQNRERNSECGRRVVFDRKSITASWAALLGQRNKMMKAA